MIEPNNQVKTELHADANQQQESKPMIIGRKRPYPGQSVFKINRETLECTLADFEEVSVEFNNAPRVAPGLRKKIVMQDGFFYVVALNKKNAMKQFYKKFGK